MNRTRLCTSACTQVLKAVSEKSTEKMLLRKSFIGRLAGHINLTARSVKFESRRQFSTKALISCGCRHNRDAGHVKFKVSLDELLLIMYVFI